MKKQKKIDPELKLIQTELEDIALRLGYKVRYEKGNFSGGYCILKESKLLVVNSRNEFERRMIIVSKCLKEIGIDDIYIKPNIRDFIEKSSSEKISSEAENNAQEVNE